MIADAGKNRYTPRVMSTNATSGLPASVKSYARYLLVMAGLGGLLYGVDVGIIAAALPYIEQTSSYTPGQLSQVVAAVLLGSVLSSLFAGMLADIFGRKVIIIVSALLFTLSIPVICLSNGDFAMLMSGRILQGASAGLVGVVVPLYLAECLGADARGKGTGMFQFLLTVGLVFAAFIGLFTTWHVEAVTDQIDTTAEILRATKISAWQTIFWISSIPGIILFFGAFRLSESPRWLFGRGRRDEALIALARNNGEEAAKEILAEMEQSAEAEKKAAEEKSASSGESLLQKKYVYPFILAVVILACTQATGINSVLNYSVKVLQQAGLEGIMSNYGDTVLKIVNMLMTIVAMSLVDKKGRKFLLKLGTTGIIVGLVGVALLFKSVESGRKALDGAQVASLITNNSLAINFEDSATMQKLGLGTLKDGDQLILTYKQGEDSNQIVGEYHADNIAQASDQDKEAIYKRAKSSYNQPIFKVLPRFVTPGEEAKQKLVINRASWNGTDITEAVAKFVTEGEGIEITLNDPETLQKLSIAANKAEGQKLAKEYFFGEAPVFEATYTQGDTEGKASIVVRPYQGIRIDETTYNKPTFMDSVYAMFGAQIQPEGTSKTLDITRAEWGEKPDQTTGWLVAVCFIIFIAFYAVGPGVCVWLALSELMPNRIRANGMAIALLINQGVSTTIAGTFLPWVGTYGYSSVFFTLAGCTVIYFITAAFFLPETKGRTLEEIEKYFTEGKMPKPNKGDQE